MGKLAKIKSKIENFFYHYKWHTIFVLFFAVVITIMAVQMVNREEYDIKVMYAGPEIISDAENAKVEAALVEIANIGSDKPKKNAMMYDLLVLNDKQVQEIYEKYGNTVSNQTITQNKEAFTYQVLSDEFFLLFLAPECYETYRKQDCIVPLSVMGINAESEIYQFRHDEYSFVLCDLDAALFYREAFTSFPPDTLVCIKRVNTMNGGNGKEVQATHIEIFKKLINFKLPDGFVPPVEDAPGEGGNEDGATGGDQSPENGSQGAENSGQGAENSGQGAENSGQGTEGGGGNSDQSTGNGT